MKKQLFLFIFVTFLISCKNFNVPVRAYFEKYTTQAVIQKNELDGTYPRNAAGIECFDSQKDHYITLYLSNPLKFTADNLQFRYEFDNPYINSYLKIYSEISPYVFISVSEDNCIWQLVFNKDFLYIVDSGAITGENNQIVKDISGNIRYNPNKNIPITQDEYESYRIDLSANTSPLRVKNAKIENGTDNFNLTFEIQNLLNPIHKIDTNGLTIQKNNNSKKHWDITNATNTMVFSDVDGTTDSLETVPINENIQITFNTDIPKDSGEGFGYTIIVEDSFGLKSSVYIEKDKGSINPPIIKYNGMEIEPSTNFKTDSNRDGMCHLTIEDISGFSEIPYICYTYSNGSNEETNTVKAPAELLLPCGDNYTINAYAFLDGYQDSESVNKINVDVKRDSIYYVANYGNDNSPTESNGSKEKPYRTIQHCINEVQGNIIANGNFINDNTYGFENEYNVDITINLLTNITPDDSSVDEQTSISRYGSLISADFTSKFTIQSADASYKTIDAQQHGSIFCMEKDNAECTFEKLNLTGGSDSGINIIECDTFTLNNVNIYGNKSVTCGGGIYVQEGHLILNNVNIYKNKASYGAGICLVTHGYTLKCDYNSGSVYENTAEKDENFSSSDSAHLVGLGSAILLNNLMPPDSNMIINLGDSSGGIVKISDNSQKEKGAVLSLAYSSAGYLFPEINIYNCVIKGNISNNNGNEKEENLFLGQGIENNNNFVEEDQKINILGDLSKSEIGITTAKKPNNIESITFTDNLPSTITPSDVFFSDEGYIVYKTNGEASLMKSGFFGDLESLSSFGINLKINNNSFVSNMTVSGSGNLDLDFTDSTSTINSVVLTDLNGNEITLTSNINKWDTASLPPDKYIIKIEFEYEGILYNYLLPFTYVKS